MPQVTLPVMVVQVVAEPILVSLVGLVHQGKAVLGQLVLLLHTMQVVVEVLAVLGPYQPEDLGLMLILFGQALLLQVLVVILLAVAVAVKKVQVLVEQAVQAVAVPELTQV
jgi:hypothetical protein